MNLQCGAADAGRYNQSLARPTVCADGRGGVGAQGEVEGAGEFFGPLRADEEAAAVGEVEAHAACAGDVVGFVARRAVAYAPAAVLGDGTISNDVVALYVCERNP